MCNLSAKASESLSYSGRLVQANGSPVSGTVEINAKLAYTNLLSSTDTFCTQNIAGVTLTNGVFHVKFDFVCKIANSAVTLTQFLSQTPANESVAIQITDVTNSKTYSFQALHSLPFANVASQLAQNGAGDGEFLKWSNSSKSWVPGTVAGATGGTVTEVFVGAPLTVSTATSTPNISLPQSNATTNGFLSSADWNTFNNKEGSLIGGTTAQYYRGDKSWQTLDTAAVPENAANLYFTNARVLGLPLTGFSATSSAIVATDTVVQGFSKAQGQINSLVSDSSKYLIKNNTDSITGLVNVGTTGLLQLNYVPVGMNDAVNKSYTDTKLALTGGTLSGALNLDSDLKIKGGANYVTVRGHGSSTAYNFVLPQSAGTNGQFLQTDGMGNLMWTTESSTAIPSGTAGGDLAGTYPNPTVPGLANKISTTLTSGNILVGNGSNVATGVAISGDATLTNTGVLTLANTGTAGTYKSVTVDAKGRVTGGTNPTTLAGYGITDTLVTVVSVTAPITNTGSAAVPLIGMPAATGAVDGYLTSANFNTFSNKQAAITSASTLNTGSLTSNLPGGLVLSPYNTSAGSTGEIRFNELAASGSNYVAFKAPDALTANVIYTLPTSDGTSGQVLTTNAAGVLSWSSHPTSAAPSGSAGGDLIGSYPNPTVANGLVATKISTGVVDNTEFNYLDGLTSAIQTQLNGKQASDPTLTSLAAYNTNGILVQTAADTFVSRSIVGTANRLTVTNGDGVAGNPTINIPTALLPSPIAGDAGKFLKASGADTSAWTMLSSSDVTTALGFTPINKAGDTMATGTFTYNGTALLRTLDPIGPTDVATKQYVDGYGQWTKGTGANAGDVYRLTGNVGIGATSPLSKLHLSSLALGDEALRISSNASNARFTVTNKSDGTGYDLNIAQDTDGSANKNFTLSTGGVEKLRINASGNVGIGTSSPTTTLELLSRQGSAGVHPNRAGIITRAEGTDVGGRFEAHVNSSIETPLFMGMRARGTLAAPQAVQANDYLVQMAGFGHDGTNYVGNGLGRIAFVAEQNWAPGSYPTYSIISTTGVGQTTDVERVRVTSGGNVGIGTNAPNANLEVKSRAINTMPFNVVNSANGNSVFKVVENSSGNGTLFVQDLTGTIAAYMGADSNMPWIGTSSNHDLRIVTNATEKMRVTAAGNVGVGVSNPGSKLEVSGQIAGKSYKTRLFQAGGRSAGACVLSSLNTTGLTDQFCDLTVTFTLTDPATVQTSYTISMPAGAAGGGRHMVTGIEVDGTVVTTNITGITDLTTTPFFGVSQTHYSDLAAGAHTIKVKYRTPTGGTSNPSANDWENRILQVMIMGYQ